MRIPPIHIAIVPLIDRDLAFAASLIFAASAYAAGSDMPWEQPLQQILDSMQGPVAKIIAVIIIIVTGLTLAFGDTAGGFRRLIQIVFGLSIAFAASRSSCRSSPSAAERWCNARRNRRLRSAAAPFADRADPACRRAARLCHPQRHDCRGARPGPAHCGSPGLLLLGRRPFASPCLPPSAIPTLRRCSRAISARRDGSHAEPRRIPLAAPTGLPIICRGRPGRARRRAQQGRQLPAHASAIAVPISTARPRPSWSPSAPGSTMCCGASAPAGRCSSRPSASRPPVIRTREFPDAASWLVDEERRRRLSGRRQPDWCERSRTHREHFESAYTLTLLYLPPADQTAGAERALLETGRTGASPRLAHRN